MVRVTFNGVEYGFKLNLAVLMATEAATAAIGEEKMSSFKTSLLLVYACLLQDETFTMSYDEFLASIDSQEELTKLFEALAAEQTRWAARNALAGAGSDETDEKKKKITISELYSVCVGDGGMSPEYFMHTLTFREVALFLEGFSQRVKREWSQAKYEAYWAACPHLKNFRYDDMPQFSWERGDDEMVDEAQQLREIEELRELARRSNANNDTNTLQYGDR